MAMTCSGMAYSWSRWNTDVQDLQKLVIQGCEQTVDEPLLEVSQASHHALRRKHLCEHLLQKRALSCC